MYTRYGHSSPLLPARHADREAEPKDYDVSTTSGKRDLLRATYARIGNMDMVSMSPSPPLPHMLFVLCNCPNLPSLLLLNITHLSLIHESFPLFFLCAFHSLIHSLTHSSHHPTIIVI